MRAWTKESFGSSWDIDAAIRLTAAQYLNLLTAAAICGAVAQTTIKLEKAWMLLIFAFLFAANWALGRSTSDPEESRTPVLRLFGSACTASTAAKIYMGVSATLFAGTLIILKFLGLNL
jgi:hypothetical protein